MDDIGHPNAGRSAAENSQGMAEDDEWLKAVAKGASRDAGNVPEEFLGDYLPMLAHAATFGQRPARSDLDAVRLLGRRAAESGISTRRGARLYLSAARRVWLELPAVTRERDNAAVRAAAEALLQVMEEAVATFAESSLRTCFAVMPT